MAGIGPVGLHGDDGEAVPLDQPLSDGGPGPIEIAGAMAGLANQHQPRLPIAIEQFTKRHRIECRQWLGKLTQNRHDGRPVGRAIVFIQQALGGCVHGRHPHPGFVYSYTPTQANH